jgi:multidrug efflux pump
MGLSAFCIRRPVFATVLSLIIVLLGLAAYERLPVREYPNIDPPVVTVRTEYPGASARIIETQVTQVLEDSLAGIEGIDYISSTSRQETSYVSVRFNLDRDPDVAASDVRDRASRVRDQLPDEIEEPIIQKAEADAEPIIYLSFSSDRHSPLELTDYADRYVKNQIQTLPGVAEVQIFGERRYAMRIWIDPLKLAAYDLTAQDVEDALRAQNVEVPAGVVESTVRGPRPETGGRLSRPPLGRGPGRARRRGRHDLHAGQRAHLGRARGGQAGDRQPARRVAGPAGPSA